MGARSRQSRTQSSQHPPVGLPGIVDQAHCQEGVISPQTIAQIMEAVINNVAINASTAALVESEERRYTG